MSARLKNALLTRVVGKLLRVRRVSCWFLYIELVPLIHRPCPEAARVPASHRRCDFLLACGWTGSVGAGLWRFSTYGE